METINNSLSKIEKKLTALETEKHLTSMLTENTGRAMLDSGGDSGRQWQRVWKAITGDASKKPEHEAALEYLRNEPAVTVDDPVCWESFRGDVCNKKHDSSDVNYTVSAFHYLRQVLSLDAICREYNAKHVPAPDWDSDIYGVSVAGLAFIKEHLIVGNTWNTYNGENTLSHILQGTNLKPLNGGVDHYVLLQVHGGADVRGGYTDARLFLIPDDFINPCPGVSGLINDVPVTCRYDGITIRRDDDGGHDDRVVPDIGCKPIVELDMDKVC